MPSSERQLVQPAGIGPVAGHDVRSARERIERRLWRAWKPLQHRLSRAQPRSRVFVAGMQRSGTNMLMEILEWSEYWLHGDDRTCMINTCRRPRRAITLMALPSSLLALSI
jgi:hypothetical protein